MNRAAQAGKRFDRIEAGPSDSAPASEALGAIACGLADHAKELGFRIISMTCSRLRGSGHRYLLLADPSGRRWQIRIAGGPLPHRTGHPEPHLDFVCRDGASGFGRALDWLDAIASGEIEWRQPQLRPRRRNHKGSIR